MIQLLKKQKTGGKKSASNPQETDKMSQLQTNNNQEDAKSDNTTAGPVSKTNISRYKDPEGLTPFKMSFGLWLVRNKPIFKFIVYIILVIISVITWSRFIMVYGEYIIFGMRYDQNMYLEMVNLSSFNHAYILSKSPRQLQVAPAQIIKASGTNYDFFAQLTNPNERFYSTFTYSFYVNNEEIGSSTSFILPDESKYLFFLNKELDVLPSQVRIVISDVKWSRIDMKTIPDWKEYKQSKLNFIFDKIKYIPAKQTGLSDKINLNTLSFEAKNDTVFNYWEADFIILLKNKGRVVGVLKYLQEHFMSEQSYEASMTIPGNFGFIDDIYIYPELDIMRDDIYIEFNGRGAQRR